VSCCVMSSMRIGGASAAGWTALGLRWMMMMVEVHEGVVEGLVPTADCTGTVVSACCG